MDAMMGLNIRISIIITFAALLMGCTHTEESVQYGVQKQHRSFVPSLIAITDCRAWPNGARFDGLPISTIQKADFDQFCARLNQFVIDGFTGQPFMRGLGSKAVQQALEKAARPQMLQEIDALWAHRAGDCEECQHAAEFYEKSIANRKEWRDWLYQFSSSVLNVDAVLLPFVTYATQQKINDRGFDDAVRKAGIVILLIDPVSGTLIWAGGREAAATKRYQRVAKVGDVTEYPAWELVYERLFLEDVWAEFPGRQLF
jgi:hypothetical protein